jgi:peptide/nickel transport system substrate-binding protein
VRKLRLFRVGAIAACVAMLGALGACGGGSGGKTSTDAKGDGDSTGGRGGGTLRLAAVYGVDSLNPFVGINSLDALTYRVVYPFLLQFDSSGKIAKSWASSYEESDGGKTWTFTLPAGGKWSDGQPLTADDAAWTITTLLTKKQPAAAFAAYLSNMVSATATSPTEVVVKFSRQTSTAAYGIANIPILPKHIWSTYAQGTGSGLLHFANTSPVGAGPFLVTKYEPKQTVLFKRNPGYWGTAPKLDAFGIVVYSNEDALISALQTNAIDVVLGAPPTAVKAVKSNPSIKLTSAPNYDVSSFWINSNEKRTTHPELRNPTVREALMLAIDRKKMSDTINLGYGATGPSILGPNHPNVDKSLPAVTYDPDKANQLLDGLGFTRGAGGIRQANGHPMSYVFRSSTVTSGYPQNANLIVADLKKIGIALKIVSSDYTSYLDAIHANDGQNFDFGLDDNNPTFDVGQFMSTLTCDQIDSQNDGRYCNPAYEKLYERQLGQTGTARQETLNAMQQLIYKDKPFIPLFWAANVFLYRSNVKGFQATPLPTVNYESTDWINNVTVR